jgi:hypothetical protein
VRLRLLLEKVMEAVGVCLCGCREGLVKPSDWLADLFTLRWPRISHGWRAGDEGRNELLEHAERGSKSRNRARQHVLDTPDETSFLLRRALPPLHCPNTCSGMVRGVDASTMQTASLGLGW